MPPNKLLSLKSLIYLGSALAMVPLLLALLRADSALLETAGLGEKSIRQVVEDTKTTRELLRIVGELERKARLFIILADLSSPKPYERESYENTRRQLRQAVDGLLETAPDPRMALLANELAEKEALLHDRIVQAEAKADLPIDEAFHGLHEAAAALWQENNARVDRKVEELHGHARSVREDLWWRGSLLVVVSLALVGGLLILLNRSIRQLDASIRALGAGEFDRPIQVSGPSDLRYLGERLEWLRIRLTTLEDSKQRFMANVSEELRTPLASLSDHAAALTAERALDSGQREHLARLGENIGKLKALFGEVLEYKRINENPQQHPRETVNMKALLDSVIEDHQARLEAKALAVKALVQPVEFFGEPDQLRTIVDNLLGNAIKFSPEAGEIRVILRATDEAMDLEVEDDGPGVDPEEAPHLFEPFFRGKAALALGAEGSGLGLAIVDECVANHQGKVEIIEPRLDEKGARFRVELPMRKVAR